jgi:uncharacterized membrane protein
MQRKSVIALEKRTLDFKRISLKEAEAAQFMNRVDSKYITSVEQVVKMLRHCSEHYYIVENNNLVLLDYSSDYFDTPERIMYMEHQNQRPKRYKIRARTYKASGDQFLEIKLKTLTGETKKKRIAYTGTESLTQETKEFIEANTPFDPEDLSPTLVTKFSRITLVSKTFDERATIDINLVISTPDKRESNIKALSVIEVKRSKQKTNSKLALYLKENQIRPMRFSKYSVGSALLLPELKKNTFKPILLKINKIINDTLPNNRVLNY